MSSTEHFNPDLESPYPLSATEIAMGVADELSPGNTYRHHQIAHFGGEVLKATETIIDDELRRIMTTEDWSK